MAWEREAVATGKTIRVFCASLADWLDTAILTKDTADLLDLITRTPHLTWLLLTKRINKIREVLSNVAEFEDTTGPALIMTGKWFAGYAPPNVWLGVTVEYGGALQRAVTLSTVPAEKRFISYEPALENVDWDALFTLLKTHNYPLPDWVIVGGESGPRIGPKRARMFNLSWGMNTITTCRQYRVACFMKQIGSSPAIAGNGGFIPFPTVHPKGGDPEEWLEVMRVRHFPFAFNAAQVV